VAVALTDLSDKSVYDVFLNEGKLLTE
jgi:hypothetical protein